MSGDRGFIALYRGYFDHPIFAPEPFTEREAFQWMIMEAAHSTHRVRRGGSMVTLERGQLAHSLRFMAKAWKWSSEKKVRGFLNKLKMDAMIDAQGTRDATHITICNYDEYQSIGRTADAQEDAPKDARRTHDGRKLEPLNHLTKDSGPASRAKGSGRKPKTTLPDSHTTSEANRKRASELGFTPQEISREAEKFRAHAVANDRRCSDWDAAERQWLLKAAEFAGKAAKEPVARREPSPDEWRQLVKTYQQLGRWPPNFGNPPDASGCRCPPEILNEFGYQQPEAA